MRIMALDRGTRESNLLRLTKATVTCIQVTKVFYTKRTMRSYELNFRNIFLKIVFLLEARERKTYSKRMKDTGELKLSTAFKKLRGDLEGMESLKNSYHD